jgi:hypothetical protein
MEGPHEVTSLQVGLWPPTTEWSDFVNGAWARYPLDARTVCAGGPSETVAQGPIRANIVGVG